MGLGAGDPERTVAAGNVLELEPALGGVEPGALVGTNHRHRARRLDLFDEVADALSEGRGDLHQARDRRRHAALLDFVNRCG